MRPTTMPGSSAAEDGGTITTAVRKKQTSIHIIHFILFICNPSFLTAFNSETESTSGFVYPYLIQFSRLFHDQIILYGLNPVDAPCDLTRLIDGLLRINEAAQLNDALVSFDTDLE